MAVNHHSRMGRALLNQTAAATSKLYADNFTLAYELNKEHIPYEAPAVALLALMLLVGTVSNALVLYIYPKYFKKTSTYYFILCMAYYDLFVCVFDLPMNIYMTLHNLDFNNPIMCKIYRLVENTAVVASALILVVVAVDRYIKIYYPFYYLSGEKIKRICAAIGVVTFILHVPPAVMLFGIARPETRIKGFRGYRCDVCEDVRNSKGAKAYTGILAALFVLILVLLCYFYGKVWLYIRQRQKVAIGETIEPVMMARLKRMANDKLRHIEEHMDDTEDVTSDSLTSNPKLKRTSTKRPSWKRWKKRSQSSVSTSKFNSSICRTVLTSVKEHAITHPYPPPSHPVRKVSSVAHNAYLDLAIPLHNKQAPSARQNAVNTSRGDQLDTVSEGDEHKHAESELRTCKTAGYDSGKCGGECKAAETELGARETKVSSATDSIPDFFERVREAGREAAVPIPSTPALSHLSTSKSLAVTTVKNNDIPSHPPTPEVSKRRDSATIDEDPERCRLSQEVERNALQSPPIAQTDSKEDTTPAAELSGDFVKPSGSSPRKPSGATDPAAGLSRRRSARFSFLPPQTRPRSMSTDSRRPSSPALRSAKKLTASLLKPLSRTTMSLVAVTVIFFLCYIFAIFILLFSNYNKNPGLVKHVVTSLLFKVNFLQNVVNPFVYAFFQLKFREHISELFQALFCRCVQSSGKSKVGNPSRITQATGNPSRITEATGNPSRITQATGNPSRITQATGNPSRITQSCWQPT